MKRIIVLIALCLCLTGCLSIDKEFVQSFDLSWQAIRPEYVNYFMADPNLDEQDKGTRLRTVQVLDELIEEALK